MPQFNLDAVRQCFPGRQVDWFDRVDSTMTEAKNFPLPGRIVGAEEQTAGVGRHGHKWISEAGSGLYVSIVLAAQPAPVMMLALGLATRDAIASRPKISVDLRWPNDVLIHGKKCAGVLAQVEGDAIIAGIGINVSQTAFPDDLETPATSLLLEGARVLREDLLIALVESIDHYSELSAEDVLTRFAEASSYVRGKRVRAEAGGKTLEGITCGLDASGFLRVREDSGAETTILAGGVRPV